MQGEDQTAHSVEQPAADDTGRSLLQRRRELLIGLNSLSGLPRGSLCALAAEIDRLPAASPTGLRALARRLAVPRRHLELAFEALPECRRIAGEEIGRAAREGDRILTRFDADYPPCLFDLPLPPPVLYLRGRLPALPGISIVGSRATDDYGREVAEIFSEELARSGLTVVSGFARGVDGAAHRGAINAGSDTVAVLGCGIDVHYPRGHGTLRRRVVDHGALVSEFAYGSPPQRWQFPVRNRLIAAMGRGTLVVRAAARSGSLITARLALELGREVFAIPGRIFDPGGPGPNSLIRDGAFLIQHPREILEALRIPHRPSTGDPCELRARFLAGDRPTADAPAQQLLPALPGAPGKVLAAIPSGAGRPSEEIAAAAGYGIERTLAILLDLELAGRIRRLPGPSFTRGGS